MATTPKLNIPYPVGTDRVMDGDNAMQAIAERVETLFLTRSRAATTLLNFNATGDALLGHGMGVVPGYVAVQTYANSNVLVFVMSVDDQIVTLRARNISLAGAPVYAGDLFVAWMAAVSPPA